MTGRPAPLLATRRGKLLLLCAAQFLDVADSSVMSVALPSIRRAVDPDHQLHPLHAERPGLQPHQKRLGLPAGDRRRHRRRRGTTALLSANATPHQALTAGFHRALLASAVLLLGAAVIALRATNTRGEPAARAAAAPALRDQVPAPELAD